VASSDNTTDRSEWFISIALCFLVRVRKESEDFRHLEVSSIITQCEILRLVDGRRSLRANLRRRNSLAAGASIPRPGS
jgi:hypothetical protein